MAESKVWFVTGASSGLGRYTTEYLLTQGHKVIATLRKPEVLSDLVSQYPPTQLVVVKVDVTKTADIVTAFSKAQEAFGRVDVVFNNAGQMIVGEVESIDEEDARGLFDINFWGAVQVSKEAVRFFREVNNPQGGRLLQVSSGLGLVGQEACSIYTASDHRSVALALEGFSECLAKEVGTWNIKITLLEPGPFLTQISQANLQMTPVHPAYTDPSLPTSLFRSKFVQTGLYDGDPRKAAVVFEKVSRLEDPPIRLPLHRRVVGLAAEKAKGLEEIVDKYGSWSDDLYRGGP
ncbi:NAD(P)-binding protein [Melanogaster broomeanus]|nr:NAD(P)-binding protein [Melanogaster broomeanus]